MATYCGHSNAPAENALKEEKDKKKAGPPIVRLWRHIKDVVKPTDDDC